MAKELSEHDKELLKKIRSLDDQSFFNWPEIAHLANQLKDESLKKSWNRTCAHYNHLEEAHNGDL